jgi:murein DD-endopeptidase MepM/ murein hydrolase activator NlpD
LYTSKKKRENAMISFLLFFLHFGQGGYIEQARDTWKPYYQDVQPTAPVDGWYLPLAASNRRDPKGYTLVSPFGAPRQSYLKGHIHTAIDMEPKAQAGTAYVYPMARGVVCSVHLGDPHRTVVLRHRLPDGKTLFTSYKHLAEVYVRNGQEVDSNAKLARLFTRAEAKKQGGLFDHLHLEVRKKFDDYGCASWLTMTRTELNEYFTDPAAFIAQHVGKNN